MVIPSPIRLGYTSLPFDHEDWLFELKYDGFRALAVIENGQCQFLSRNLNPLRGLDTLANALVKELKVDRAILDGELAVIDQDGRSIFRSMMFERKQARYCAFDLLSVYRHDLAALPLLKRKERLRQILPQRSAHLLYVDHVMETGKVLFDWACAWDLEGIVAKKANSRYEVRPNGKPSRDWLKIKNRAYSQKEGREGLFDKKQKKALIT
jgi:bifunctional non-homologous end joining protein LigD